MHSKVEGCESLWSMGGESVTNGLGPGGDLPQWLRRRPRGLGQAQPRTQACRLEMLFSRVAPLTPRHHQASAHTTSARGLESHIVWNYMFRTGS